nr:hypothetical protein [Propionibacterium freudenreichii]
MTRDDAVQRCLDGLVGLVADGLLVVEDDLVEEGSVEDAAFSRFASRVDVAEIGEDVGELVEALTGVLVAGGEVLQSVFDGVEGGADAVLLGLEEVERDGVGVVGLDELESLGVEFLLLGGQECTFVVGGGFELIEDGSEDFADTIGLGGGEAVGAVGGVDAVLDAVGEDGGPRAAVLLAAPGAGEVLVGDAGLAGGAFDHHLRSAGAVERSLEVVVVGAGLLSALVLRRQLRLDSQPGFGVDERVVSAVVGDAAESDAALVVGVREDLVQRFRGHRFRGEGRGGAGGEPTGFQLFREGGESPVAGGVGGEGEGDQVGAFGIDGDISDLTPLGISGAHVQVPEGCFGRSAAHAGFLGHSFEDFLSEVQGVELGHGGEDAVHEHP